MPEKNAIEFHVTDASQVVRQLNVKLFRVCVSGIGPSGGYWA